MDHEYKSVYESGSNAFELNICILYVQNEYISHSEYMQLRSTVFPFPSYHDCWISK